MLNCRMIIIVFLALASPIFAYGQDNHGRENDQIQQDVARLIDAAAKLDKAWPWQGAIPEVDRVAKHGRLAAPLLVSHLKFKTGMHFEDEGWDLHVEQQIELALCKIYNIKPGTGKSVYSIRAFDQDNWTIEQFWQEKVASEPMPAQPGR